MDYKQRCWLFIYHLIITLSLENIDYISATNMQIKKVVHEAVEFVEDGSVPKEVIIETRIVSKRYEYFMRLEELQKLIGFMYTT